jgi:hypothetical protein
VVGERVRELRRDRTDLAADAPEVVQQSRPLDRQERQEACQGEDVDNAAILSGLSLTS